MSFFGMVSSYTLGGYIHLLLVLAIAVVLIRVIQGRCTGVNLQKGIHITNEILNPDWPSLWYLVWEYSHT